MDRATYGGRMVLPRSSRRVWISSIKSDKYNGNLSSGWIELGNVRTTMNRPDFLRHSGSQPPVKDNVYWWGVTVLMLLLLSLFVSQVCQGCAPVGFVKDPITSWAGWDRGEIAASVDKEGEVWVTSETTFHVLSIPVTMSGAFRYDDGPQGRMCLSITAWIKPLCIDLPFGGTKGVADSVTIPSIGEATPPQ